MIKHAYWAWAVKNSVLMICWTIIAICFGKWWISLFSMVTLSSFKQRETAETAPAEGGDALG